MKKPITKAELDALEQDINRQNNRIQIEIAAYEALKFATRLIADHRRLVESNAALLEIIRQASLRCNSGQDHECGWSPQSEKHITEAAEYLRQWEGNT